jgi:hypothetical protein
MKLLLTIELDRTYIIHMSLRNLNFTKYQNDILLGSMLGDGSLSKIKNVNSYFSERHSLKQSEYLNWKYESLLPFSSNKYELTTMGRKNECGKIVPDNSKKYQSIVFTTLSHPFLTEIEKSWYKRDIDGKYILNNGRRIKTIPKNLIITPLILSVWYMDDGWIQENNASICCQCFTSEECKFLRNQIFDLGINNIIYFDKKTNIPKSIKILSESIVKFTDMVRQYIPCSCMEYKLKRSKINLRNKRNSIFDENGTRLTGFRKKDNKWRVSISLNSKNLNVGLFPDLETAIAVSKKAQKMKKEGILDPLSYADLALKYGYFKRKSQTNLIAE